MLAFSYYLLKVVLASAILYGYYWMALRNKVFHQWNRFYLLATLILSLLLPMVKINIWREPQAANSGVIQLLQVVSTGDEFVEQVGRTSNSAPGADLVSFIYVFVGISVMVGILFSLLKILRLFKTNPRQILGDIRFVNTEAEGTPFSFFHFIFWNTKIDIHSNTGQHIFKHELAHVREKHSLDKMLVNLFLTAFWANPIFWLIRRELGLVHEFIADQKSVEQNDTRAFAAMILQSAYPQHQLPLTNAFFYSPLKRRLLMLTKIQNQKIGYASRIMVLPLAALVFAAFALKPKTTTFNALVGATDRNITVMIDPGHGGTDDGALAPDGTKEKDFNLAIAKKIQKLNPYKNIIIMLSRDEDKTIDVRERVEFAKKSNIDAYISIHANVNGTSDHKPSGIELYVSRKPQTYGAYTRLLGSLVAGELSKTYKTDQVLKKNESSGVWVLDAPDMNYPSLLIECGNLSLPEDLKYMTATKNQDAIALSILKSISNFAASPVPKLEGASAMADTSVPKKLPKGVKSMEYTIDGNVIVMYNNGKAEKLTLEQTVQKGYITRSNSEGTNNLKKALIIVDGKEMPAGYDVNNLEPTDITEISVLKNWEAASKYGEKGKFGVLIIKTKSGKPSSGMIVKPDLAENYKIMPDGKTAGGQTYDKPRPDANQVKPQ